MKTDVITSVKLFPCHEHMIHVLKMLTPPGTKWQNNIVIAQTFHCENN